MKKPRNAYVIPARQRGNAGAMVHKGKKREKISIDGECPKCGKPVVDNEPTCDCDLEEE